MAECDRLPEIKTKQLKIKTEWERMSMKHLKQTVAALLAVILVLGVLAGCGSEAAPDTSEDDAAQAEETNAPEETEAPEESNEDEAVETSASSVIGNGVNLSSLDYDFQAEYFYSDYNAKSNEDADRQDGIDTFDTKDIVFKSLYYDELNYLLQQEGNYLILLGGSWCHNTRAVIRYINEYAKEYGIDTVYNFDFRLDGETSGTHIRESAQTPEYGGEKTAVADWNYLYGELIDNYLTNLNDWVEYKEDSESALTWYDENYEAETVAKVQVPFLFLYNKDNTTHYVPVYDENGKQTGVEADESASGTYPIVIGFEEMVDRDSNGIYDGADEDGNRSYITDEYLVRLQNVFDFIRDSGVEISYYSDADYLVDAFVEGNGRGHSPKLYDVFTEGEQINIEVITYRQMNWLLSQEGSAAIVFGGAWCANTTAAIGPINDYAVANDVKVYLMDFRLDGKFPIDFWDYDRDRQFEIRSTLQDGSPEQLAGSTFVGQPNPFAYLYTNLINTYLTNVESITDPSADNYYITYVNEDGTETQAIRLQAPYLLAYNKDAVDADGFPAPVLAWHEEMLEITENSLENGSYIYQKDNYASYTAGIEEVLTAVAESTGSAFTPYTGAPRQELTD